MYLEVHFDESLWLFEAYLLTCEMGGTHCETPGHSL